MNFLPSQSCLLTVVSLVCNCNFTVEKRCHVLYMYYYMDIHVCTLIILAHVRKYPEIFTVSTCSRITVKAWSSGEATTIEWSELSELSELVSEVDVHMSEHIDTTSCDSYLLPFVAMCNSCEEDFAEVRSCVDYQIPHQETSFSQNSSEIVTGSDGRTQVSINIYVGQCVIRLGSHVSVIS